MNQEDKALVSELDGDDLSEEGQSKLLSSYYESLRMKVSMALEDLLTDEQLEEFDKISRNGNEIASEEWFKTTVPNYDQIVAEQADILKQDIKQHTAIIESAIDETDD
jgi:hypothetical protein